MDCQMPVMNGLEATRAIRRQEREGNRTPIVALTASMTDLDREACLEAGMDDLVRKPVRPELLHAMLRRWTGFVATTDGPTKPRATRPAHHGEAA
jgi:CheY-like chemotaxis protein